MFSSGYLFSTPFSVSITRCVITVYGHILQSHAVLVTYQQPITVDALPQASELANIPSSVMFPGLIIVYTFVRPYIKIAGY